MSYVAVLDMFVRFSTPLEGDEPNPYPDDRNLITVGIGCLLDTTPENGPPSFNLATSLAWVLPDGSTPTSAEVIRQLTALKQLDLRNYRANSATVLNATTIRLTPAGILKLVSERLAQDEPFLRKAFTNWDTLPADVQLFAFSVAWAEGAGFPAENPNLTRLINAGQFLLAIEHAPDANHPGQWLPAAADISTKNNPGIVPRNAQNALALSNAQLVVDRNLPRDILYWPNSPLTVSDPTVA